MDVTQEEVEEAQERLEELPDVLYHGSEEAEEVLENYKIVLAATDDLYKLGDMWDRCLAAPDLLKAVENRMKKVVSLVDDPQALLEILYIRTEKGFDKRGNPYTARQQNPYQIVRGRTDTLLRPKIEGAESVDELLDEFEVTHSLRCFYSHSEELQSLYRKRLKELTEEIPEKESVLLKWFIRFEEGEISKYRGSETIKQILCEKAEECIQ